MDMTFLFTFVFLCTKRITGFNIIATRKPKMNGINTGSAYSILESLYVSKDIFRLNSIAEFIRQLRRKQLDHCFCRRSGTLTILHSKVFSIAWVRAISKTFPFKMILPYCKQQR